MKNVLNVGDVLYSESSWHGLRRAVVIRVTRTQAELDLGYKLRRSADGKYHDSIPVSLGLWWEPETDELKLKYETIRQRKDLENRWRAVNYKNLSSDQLERILNIVDEDKK